MAANAGLQKNFGSCISEDDRSFLSQMSRLPLRDLSQLSHGDSSDAERVVPSLLAYDLRQGWLFARSRSKADARGPVAARRTQLAPPP
jgi:hypothetical protein